MKTLIGFLRPSSFLGYPVVAYGVIFAMSDWWVKSLTDHTHDYALAYSLSTGFAFMLGILAGTQVFYLINLLFLRYLRAIQARLESIQDLLGLPPWEPSSNKASLFVRSITWSYVVAIVAGAMTASVAICTLVVLFAVGFPDWAHAFNRLLVGLGILALGLTVGFLQCYRLDRQVAQLESQAIARLREANGIERVSDGVVAVATVEKGEKWVGTLTGVRSGALTPA